MQILWNKLWHSVLAIRTHIFRLLCAAWYTSVHVYAIIYGDGGGDGSDGGGCDFCVAKFRRIEEGHLPSCTYQIDAANGWNHPHTQSKVQWRWKGSFWRYERQRNRHGISIDTRIGSNDRFVASLVHRFFFSFSPAFLGCVLFSKLKLFRWKNVFQFNLSCVLISNVSK